MQLHKAIAPQQSLSIPRLVNRKAAAQTLGLSLRKIDYLLARGELAAVKIDGRTLIACSEIQRFVESKTVRKAS
jgi:excisionase family DNA binding protein